MPSNNTLAPTFLAAWVMAVKLAAVMSRGKPRRASLPPSSITTMLGVCVLSKAARRERPPDVVSPLMLALTTLADFFSVANCFSSKGTQPVPRRRPYSALSESPTIKIVSGVAAKLGKASNPVMASANSDLKPFAATPRQSLVSFAALKPLGSKVFDKAVMSVSVVSSNSIVAVEHIFKSVSDSTGTLTILRDIDFALAPRETAAIVGASGSGKSTLLSIIAGLDTPTSGTVWLAGQDIFALNEDDRAALRAQKVGFVFQSFQLMGNLTALENVMLPLELSGSKNARSMALEMLKRVGLGERLSHYPKVLSGGEQQRVALARAFVVQPAVLLADEPTGSLDFATGETVMQLMFELNRELGTTLVLVTHDKAIAARCERRIVIEAGQIKLESPEFN